MSTLKAAISGIVAMFVMILAFVLLIAASILFGTMTGLFFKFFLSLSSDQGYRVAVVSTLVWVLIFVGAGIGIADKK